MARRDPVVFLVLLGTFAYGTSAFHVDANREVVSVSVNLAKPESIIWPFEISVVGDEGEKGIRIPPRVGAGWTGGTGGQAGYRFYVPEDGKYNIWTYAWWYDQCSNAVYAQVDLGEKVILGNDPIYGQWHWTRGCAVQLKKGPHALTLSNHSDHISLQKILFVNSGWVHPEDCSLVFSDVFYDGFDGCDIGNFASWDVRAGVWTVEKPRPEIRCIGNALLGVSQNEATIVYRGDDWSQYSFHASVRTAGAEGSQAAAGMLFGMQDAEHYHQLVWTPVKGTNTVQMELSRREAQTREVLGSFPVEWAAEQWHEVEIVLGRQKTGVLVDQRLRIEVPTDQDITGGIGLHLRGTSKVYFDEIHVRMTLEGRSEELD